MVKKDVFCQFLDVSPRCVEVIAMDKDLYIQDFKVKKTIPGGSTCDLFNPRCWEVTSPTVEFGSRELTHRAPKRSRSQEVPGISRRLLG